MLKRLTKLILEAGILLAIFVLGCYVCGFMLEHSIFILLFLLAEVVIFGSWELTVRENRQAYYGKGGEDYENP